MTAKRLGAGQTLLDPARSLCRDLPIIDTMKNGHHRLGAEPAAVPVFGYTLNAEWFLKSKLLNHIPLLDLNFRLLFLVSSRFEANGAGERDPLRVADPAVACSRFQKSNCRRRAFRRCGSLINGRECRICFGRLV